jgi:hypothetical protein
MELRRNRRITTTLNATVFITIGVALLAATDETPPPVSYIFSTIAPSSPTAVRGRSADEAHVNSKIPDLPVDDFR